jgi:hypothetical protein
MAGDHLVGTGNFKGLKGKMEDYVWTTKQHSCSRKRTNCAAGQETKASTNNWGRRKERRKIPKANGAEIIAIPVKAALHI